jgi:hypothetical protein
MLLITNPSPPKLPPRSFLQFSATGPDGGKYTDEAEGLLCPEAMQVFIDVWKRPEELLQGQPDVPMVLLDPEAEAGPNGKRALVAENALFSGTSCVEWLFMVGGCTAV